MDIPHPPHAGEWWGKGSFVTWLDIGTGISVLFFLLSSLALKISYCYTKNCYIFYFKTKIAIKLLSLCVYISISIKMNEREREKRIYRVFRI